MTTQAKPSCGLSIWIVITPLSTGELFYTWVYHIFGGIRIGFCLSNRPWRLNMDNTPAYSIFLGLLIGSILGFGIGAVNGDAVQGMQLGAITGVFIGWVVTALTLQKQK
jgi:outer membrane lipoprotein SlyB